MIRILRAKTRSEQTSRSRDHNRRENRRHKQIKTRSLHHVSRHANILSLKINGNLHEPISSSARRRYRRHKRHLWSERCNGDSKHKKNRPRGSLNDDRPTVRDSPEKRLHKRRNTVIHEDDSCCFSLFGSNELGFVLFVRKNEKNVRSMSKTKACLMGVVLCAWFWKWKVLLLCTFN